MTATKEIPLVSKACEEHFSHRAELSAEISALEKRVAALKKERAEEDEKLSKWFREGEENRLRDGSIVILKTVTVAAVVADDEWIAANRGKEIRKGFSYPKYDVIAGTL